MTFDGKTAFLFMKKGEKVRHAHWYWGRYVIYSKSSILDEKGGFFPCHYFMDGLDDIWEIYNEEKHGLSNCIGSNMEDSGGCGEQGIT